MQRVNDSADLKAPEKSARTALAGALAGAITATLLHPIDTAKTIRQSSPHAVTRSLTAVLANAVRERGPGAMYAGLLPSVLGSAPSSALYFGTYEGVRVLLRVDTAERAIARERVRLFLNMLAAACGNVVSSVLFVPKEVIKQRMQSGKFGTRLIPALGQMIQRENGGMRSLYAGYRATLLRNIPSNMLKFAVYEEVKLLILRLRQRRSGVAIEHLSHAEHIFAGALSGMVSSGLTTPMDVLKTRFATARGAEQSLSLGDMVVRVVKQCGARGLFVGLRARLTWSALFTAIGFTTYEYCKRLVMPRRRTTSAQLARRKVAIR